jgi:hypothetical protein
MSTPRRRSGLAALLSLLALTLDGPFARAEPGPNAEDGAAVEKWIRERATAAKKGEAELVRIPITFRAMGWGCSCPAAFVGVNVGTHNGGETWVKVVAGPYADLPGVPRLGIRLVAEGHFTGARVKEDLRGKDGPAESLYHLWELKVLRSRSLRDREGGEDSKVHVVLSGKDAKEKVAALSDDRPFLVVVESFLSSEKASEKRAQVLKERLVKAGFGTAEVLDSRSAPRLFCCYRVVVSGRHKDRGEALTEAKAVRLKGFKGVYVRKGW